MFFCSRSFYLFLVKKVFLFQCKCCIETRFSRCSSQEYADFMVLLNLFGYNSLNTLALPFSLMHKGKSLNYSHYVTPIHHSCIYLSFFPIFLRLCDHKFVFHFWACARCCRSVVTVFKYHCSSIKEEQTVTKAKSLLVRLFHFSQNLAEAAKHLSDGSKKCICHLSFEF